ncbi:hypothetical protein NL676_028922 [Syzygium grande]|nr:hypothetical protein NL676_028922 [Syzygium grande]
MGPFRKGPNEWGAAQPTSCGKGQGRRIGRISAPPSHLSWGDRFPPPSAAFPIARGNPSSFLCPAGGLDGFESRGVLHRLSLPAVNTMSTPARKRLMRDFKRLQQDPPAGISGAPQDNNIMLWNAVIFGPDDTPWDGGTFKLTLQFTEDYPNKPPTVRFVSRMFHPNIYADGSICLDILQNQWSPIYDVAAILTSIQSLLCDPNPNSPANSEAARMFSENKREYNRRGHPGCCFSTTSVACFRAVVQLLRLTARAVLWLVRHQLGQSSQT